MFSYMTLVFIVVLLSQAQAFFGPPRFHRLTNFSRKLNMLDISTIITAVVETKPDDYVYGAVAAPSWALPLGAVLVIGTAALPVLLRPGEAALEQQRIDEETKGSQFNKKGKL